MNEETGLIKLVSHGKPSKEVAWNELASLNGNLLQSRHSDIVSAMFKEIPLYFEIWSNNELIAGVKLFYHASSRIPILTKPLSKSLLQLSEGILKPGSAGKSELMNQLNQMVGDFVIQKKIVYLRTNGFYDDQERIIKIPGQNAASSRKFINAYINLNQPLEVIWEKMHDHHKREIEIAGKNSLTVVMEDDFGAFKHLLMQTFQNQNIPGPNFEYLERLYNEYSKLGFAELFFVVERNEKVSVALITAYGNYAHFSFGGKKKSKFSTGPLLHWEVIKYYKAKGLEKYFLGQMAIERDLNNLKFSDGITWFKRQFGPEESESCQCEYIFKPVFYRVWKYLLKLYGADNKKAR